MAERTELVLGMRTEGIDKAARETERVTTAARKAETQAKQTRRATEQFGNTASSTAQKLRQLADRTESLGRAMTQSGKALTVGLTLPIVGIGTAAAKTAGDFESAMNRVAAVSGATEAQLGELTAQARSLGATTQFSASEAAGAMGFLAQAGFKTDKIMTSMNGTLNLAAAAQIDLAESADIVSNVMSGFEIQAEDLDGTVDVLTKTFTSSNTNLSQLGDAMSYVAPVANSLGVSIEETAAAVGALSNAGIQGSRAGTSFSRVLSVITQNADKLGVTLRDSEGNMLPFADVLAQIEERGLSAQESIDIFGQRAGPAIQVLLSSGSDALREFTGELDNAGGTAEQIAETQMQGFNGLMKEFKSVMEEVGIVIGNIIIPVLTDIFTRIKDALTGFTQLDERTQRFVITLAALAAGIGPLLLVVGKLITSIRGVSTALTFLAANPIVAAIAGVAALATAIYGLVRAGDAWVDKQNEMARAEAADFETTRVEALMAAESIDELGAGFPGLTQEMLDAAHATGDFVGALEAMKRIPQLELEIDRLEDSMENGAAGFREAQQAIETLEQPLTDSGKWWEGAATETERFQNALENILGPGGMVSDEIREVATAEQLAAIGAAVAAEDTEALKEALSGLGTETQELIDLRAELEALQSGATLVNQRDGEGTPGGAPEGTDRDEALKSWREWWEEVTGVSAEGQSGTEAARAYLEQIQRELEVNQSISEAMGEKFDPVPYLEQQSEEIRTVLATLLSIPADEIDEAFTMADGSISTLLGTLDSLMDQLAPVEEETATLNELFQQQLERVDMMATVYEQLGIEYDAAAVKSDLVTSKIRELGENAEMSEADIQSFIAAFGDLIQKEGEVITATDEANTTFSDSIDRIEQLSLVYRQLGQEYDAIGELQSAYTTELERLTTVYGANSEEVQELIRNFDFIRGLGDEVTETVDRMTQAFMDYGTALGMSGEEAEAFADSMDAVKDRVIDLAQSQAISFARDLGQAWGDTREEGESAKDAIRNLAQAILDSLPSILLQIAGALAPTNPYLALALVAAAASTAAVSGYVEGRQDSVTENATGNVFRGGEVVPFASGGIVTQPTLFPMANGTGLMGEAGPEAVVPLERMSDGSLGVGSNSAPVQVTVNNYSSENVEVQENDDGEITVVVGNMMRSQIENGELDGAMRNRYGMKVQGVS